MEALRTWVEESLLKRLRQTSCFSIITDEFTDIFTIEEMWVFCHWEEGGSPEEHLLAIVHLNQPNAESIYYALVECLKEKQLQVGLQVHSQGRNPESRLRSRNYGTTCFICALLLPLVTVGQAANSTNGIKHVYVSLTALWKFQREQSLACLPSRQKLAELSPRVAAMYMRSSSIE